MTGLPVGECPLCSDPREGTHITHGEACVFTAGSLYCIKPACKNPHHVAPPGARLRRP